MILAWLVVPHTMNALCKTQSGPSEAFEAPHPALNINKSKLPMSEDSNTQLCLPVQIVSRHPNLRNDRDLTGIQRGRLTAVKPEGIAPDGHQKWLCKCQCGGLIVIHSNSLIRKRGGTRSCGCLLVEAAKKRRKKSGPWNEGKSYAVLKGQKCYSTKHAWRRAVLRHYGNKCGICGWSEAPCDAHHRKSKADGGLHTVANGIVLCPNHHRLVHVGKLRL